MTKKTPNKASVQTWIYPEDGSEGKIISLPDGAKCPDGYAFEPCEPAPEIETSDGYEPKIGDREAEITDLNEQLKAAQGLVKTRDGEIAALQDKLKTARDELAKLGNDADAKINEMETSLKEAETFRDEYEKLKAKIKPMADNEKRLISEIKQSEATIESLNRLESRQSANKKPAAKKA